MSGSPPSPSKGDDKAAAASPIESIDMDPADAHAGLAGFDYEGVKEQDRWLPIANESDKRKTSLYNMSGSSASPSDKPNGFANHKTEEIDANIRNFAPVARIMKNALPENAKIAKEAKECMQECVSEFISFITSEASEKCQQEKRKTVNGEDILFAMTSLGFENYSEALKVYLSKYREQQNASNRERVMDNTQGWSGGMMQDKADNPGDGVEGGADPNYMYAAQGGHNGNGTGEGY
ncbi:histone-like transcription factor (CBF/NF-Y) and archaeal histone domain-containing protein [Sarocladium implicatum]|nr:histone-like transcription factor (CBF/NF-Y) and archaeal histone domain-containing protein [Sarocladium implicatum]